MGASESRALYIFNGTSFLLRVTLTGSLIEYKKDGSSDVKISSVARVGNGSYIQVFPAEKYVEVAIVCTDELDRQVKLLTFFTSDDVSWVVRNHGVMRPKQGTFGMTADEDYSQNSSTFFREEHGGNWKKDHGGEIRFYDWDVDNESVLTKLDRENRDELEELRERERAYGSTKNWVVLANAANPKSLSKPDKNQLVICKEFISACQLYTATMVTKVPTVWLVYLNVESLQKNKELNNWQLVIQGIESVTENHVFERIFLENDTRVFCIVHIQQGPMFTIRGIQEALTDSMVHQTDVWLTDHKLDLSQLDRLNRNFRVYNTVDNIKFWVPGKPKYNIGVITVLLR